MPRPLAVATLFLALGTALALGGCDSGEVTSLDGPVALSTDPSARAYTPFAFRWRPVPDAVAYEVALTRTFGPTMHYTVTATTERPQLDTTLALGAYSWRVRALNGEVQSAWSDSVRFSLDEFRAWARTSFSWNTGDVQPDRWYDTPRTFIPGLSFDATLDSLEIHRSIVRSVRTDSVWLRIDQPAGHLFSDYAALRLDILGYPSTETLWGHVDPAPARGRARLTLVPGALSLEEALRGPGVGLSTLTSGATPRHTYYEVPIEAAFTVTVDLER